MEIKHSVLGALTYLASQCDGAQDRDGAGFSGSDADFGNDLARKAATFGLSEKQFACAKKFAHKYRKQLRSAGFELELIADEVWIPAQAAAKPVANKVALPAWRLDAFPNRYAGKCAGCGARVDAGHGVCGKLGTGKWAVRCNPTCGAPEADPAVDPDHADPAYWRHCAQVEREAGNMAGAAVLELYAADMADPRVHVRVVGPNGEALR